MYFSPDFSWDDAVVVTISDASFCQEQEQIDGVVQNFKSQQACITVFFPGNALNAEKMLGTSIEICHTFLLLGLQDRHVLTFLIDLEDTAHFRKCLC